MECGQSLIEVLISRNPATQIRRCVWIIFFMGITLSAPFSFGQRFVRPTYAPSTVDAYFSGDSNRVFPNPFKSENLQFQPAPGESNPVPNREVRQKNRAERREKILKRFGVPQNEEKDSKEQTTSSTFKVVYPDSDRTDRNASQGPSPAPFLWDSEVSAAPGETTEALPFNDPEDVSPSTEPTLLDDEENDSEENFDLELEDITAPANENIFAEVPEDVTQKSILEDAASSQGETPKKAVGNQQKTTVETEEPDFLDLEDEDLAAATEELNPKAENKAPRFRRRPMLRRNPDAGKAEEAEKVEDAEEAGNAEDAEDAENTEDAEDDEESIDLILEPVPEITDSRKEHSILPMAQVHRDFNVQQTAFFSSGSGSQNSVQYPVRKNTVPSWPGFSKPESQKKTRSEVRSDAWGHSSDTRSTANDTRSTVSSNSTDSPAPQHSILTESSRKETRPVSIPKYPSKPRETVSAPSAPSEDLDQQNQAVSLNTDSQVTPSRTKDPQPAQRAVSGTEQQTVPVYDPPFPELKTPTSRLEMTQPMRMVFKDFGIRKSVEKSSLPWYAQYIRELDVNEEHLFNSLRVLGNAKLSQSQCQFTLMEAGIIASQPKTADEANRLLNIYENIEYGVLQKMHQVDARQDMTDKQKEELKAELILDFMHQKVFVKYVLEGTTVNNLLEHGYYNCVTASLLFCSLAEKAGLNVTAVELPGHAMCWVYLSNGERLEVETTCGNWFKYRNDPETQQKVICKLIRDASPQLKDQSDKMLLLQVPQPISDKRLIAKIYYNRGVDLLGSGDYAGALEANAIAYCLDLQSETTFGNLLATMNNWAIALCRDGKYEEATALLREGLRHQPNYPPFKNNHTHVYHHWVDSLYRNGQMNEALQVAAIAASEQPDVDHFKRLQEQIQQNIAIANQQQTTTW